MSPSSAVLPPSFWALTGAVLLGVTLVLALVQGLSQRQERGLGHLLAGFEIQGLILLAMLGGPWPGLVGASLALGLLAGAGYGLWALRRYAGVPVRLDRWGWLALGSWLLLAVALRAMGFLWVRELVLPALLTAVALGSSRELGRLAPAGAGRAPAQVAAALAALLAVAALSAGGVNALMSGETSAEVAALRVHFLFAALLTQQLITLLLIQIQGQRLRTRLEALLGTDPVTGLASAQGFRLRLERAVGRSLRTGRPTSMLLLELDDFEDLVLDHGSSPANRILEAFAQTLQQTLREADHCARLDGARFAALLHHTPPQEAQLAAERLRSVWENQPLALGARALRPTLSGGVASTREAVDGAEDLLALALGRAISARAAGGNNVEAEAVSAP